ncbi:flagellar hook-associated protein FlgL [Cytobacillus spongiae]|uniref:flagellar hook-associated protein FlgL n=1 Tax=Cytobacillus spongiae TaxID=2901381 RepID=UPI001F3485E7|nr:flagellar hook-associated protein FlgL [Cytobacillus spongiae]UII55615.1 flagellar hook-associated protein FlgL [Cytobacillus spongiae]
MRVTQNMLIRNNLSYISNNYERYGEIQDQINTNKKITRPSQDPVVAIKGMRYRSQVVEVEQFKRNLSEAYSWMDNADATLDETTNVLHRIKELTIQASNETYTPDQRDGVAKEINELLSHLESLANTRVNNKYIFNGTDTNSKPVDIASINKSLSELTLANGGDYMLHYQGKHFQFSSSSSSTAGAVTTNNYVFTNGNEQITINIDKEASKEDVISIEFDGDIADATNTPDAITEQDIILSGKNAVATNKQDVNIEVMKGINIDINIRPQHVFSPEMFRDITDLVKALKEPSQKADGINPFISKIEAHMDNVTNERADLGAKYNRVELIEQRLALQEVIAKDTMSDNEDIDFEKAIIDLKIQESLHRASLAMGARIIQPTLMDFLR